MRMSLHQTRSERSTESVGGGAFDKKGDARTASSRSVSWSTELVQIINTSSHLKDDLSDGWFDDSAHISEASVDIAILTQRDENIPGIHEDELQFGVSDISLGCFDELTGLDDSASDSFAVDDFREICPREFLPSSRTQGQEARLAVMLETDSNTLRQGPQHADSYESPPDLIGSDTNSDPPLNEIDQLLVEVQNRDNVTDLIEGLSMSFVLGETVAI